MIQLNYILVTILYLSIIVLSGCDTHEESNIHEKTVKKMLNTMNEIDRRMEEELLSDKSFVKNLFVKKINEQPDYIIKEKLENYNHTINRTIIYFDTLINETNNLDKYDQASIDFIKVKYLQEGVADSIFQYSKICFDVSEHLAKDSSSRAKIKKIRQSILNEPDIQTAKNAYFSMTSPPQVKAILFDFEIGILNSAKIVLDY